MTVPIETSRVEFTGNGVTTVFGTTFDFDTSAQLVVKLILISTGAQTIQTLGVHYTVSGGAGVTGNVTMLTAPSSLNTLRIERDVAIVQDTDFPVQGVAPVAVEAALDHLTWACQQLSQRTTDLEDAASSTTVVLAGNGLTKSVDTLHVGAGSGVQVNADSVEVLYGAAPGNVTKAAASAGVANTASRSDHKHDITTAVVGTALVGAAPAEGTATSLARSDHAHGFTAPAAPANVTKAAADAGAATSFARSDHKHDITTAAAATITTANAEGSATSVARSDHTHDHGALLGGDRHAVATTSTAGFMSSTDKTKLDAFTVSTGTVQTTDATVTTIIAITPTDETVESIEASIVGLQSSGATGAGYLVVGTFRRDGGTTVQIGATTVLATHEDTAGWDVTFVVASPVVNLKVTGAAATNINWKAVAKRLVHP